jgi:hypothetical protein
MAAFSDLLSRMSVRFVHADVSGRIGEWSAVCGSSHLVFEWLPQLKQCLLPEFSCYDF